MAEFTLGDLLEVLSADHAMDLSGDSSDMARVIRVKDFDRPLAWIPEGVSIDAGTGDIIIHGALPSA